MIALLAETNEVVDKFHATALENGAVDEGVSRNTIRWKLLWLCS